MDVPAKFDGINILPGWRRKNERYSTLVKSCKTLGLQKISKKPFGAAGLLRKSLWEKSLDIPVKFLCFSAVTLLWLYSFISWESAWLEQCLGFFVCLGYKMRFGVEWSVVVRVTRHLMLWRNRCEWAVIARIQARKFPFGFISSWQHKRVACTALEIALPMPIKSLRVHW